MNRRRGTGYFSLVAGIVAVAAGCAVPRMAPPADVVDGTDVLVVSDRSRVSGALVNEGFKIGSYEVVDVDRDWNSTKSVGIGPWSKETKTTGFAYSLQSKGKKIAGKCSSESQGQSIGGIAWGSLKIACQCEGAGAKAEILMTDEGRSLKAADKEYKFTPINTIEGGKTQSEPSGFRADADKLLGAVEVNYPGQVWLAKGLDEPTKVQVTCLFVGMVLYQPPKNN